MFGPPGSLYFYFTYGMHWCANVVCAPAGTGEAVLIRALAPIEGHATMRARRPAALRDRDLCSGPAKLCQALGVTGAHDGVDLGGAADVWLEPPAGPDVTPAEVACGPRIGITKAVGLPRRWWVKRDLNLSRPDR